MELDGRYILQNHGANEGQQSGMRQFRARDSEPMPMIGRVLGAGENNLFKKNEGERKKGIIDNIRMVI